MTVPILHINRLRDAFLRVKATGDHTAIAGFAVEAIPALLDMLDEADRLLARYAALATEP